MRGWKDCLLFRTLNPQPNFGPRSKKQTGRKLGVGWRVEGKKFKEGRLGGIAPPPNRNLQRGGFRRSEKRREEGVILRAERDTRATRGWHPGHQGQEGGEGLCAQSGRGAAPKWSLLLPAARLGACCFLLGIAQLRSSPTSGAPAPAARGARGLARLPGLLRLLPGGS